MTHTGLRVLCLLQPSPRLRWHLLPDPPPSRLRVVVQAAPPGTLTATQSTPLHPPKNTPCSGFSVTPGFLPPLLRVPHCKDERSELKILGQASSRHCTRSPGRSQPWPCPQAYAPPPAHGCLWREQGPRTRLRSSFLCSELSRNDAKAETPVLWPPHAKT